MKEIVFVTGNLGKRKSAEKHLKNVSVTCLDFNFIEPDINDIEYIAKEKVIDAYKHVNKPCIALDAGFYIPNYPGNPNFPGAFPKRELLDKIGIEGLLKNMEGTKDRQCYFKECLAYYDGENIKYFYGVSKGRLSTEIKGNNTSKKWSELWYVFIPDNNSKTLAEMTDEERQNRNDLSTSAIEEFSNWYNEIKILTKDRINK